MGFDALAALAGCRNPDSGMEPENRGNPPKIRAPRAAAQVELFEKTEDGKVQITFHRTDETGHVRVPVQRGRRYLADAVVMRPLDAATSDGAVWESLWASLTFAVPN